MSTTTLLSFVRRMLRSTSPAPRRRWNALWSSEALESRWLLTPRIWDGGAITNDKWTDRDNWVGNVAPVAGDDLIFPAGIGILDRSTNNDFANGTLFNSIRFEGDDFTLAGNQITLKAGGFIETANTSGSNRIDFRIKLEAGSHKIDLASNLVLNGQLTSVGTGVLDVFVDAGRSLIIGGAQSNTARHDVVLHHGSMTLAKTGGADAIGGNFTIGDPTFQQAVVNSTVAGGQLFGGINITMRNGTNGVAVFNIGPSSESIGKLTMNGATINGNGLSSLKLNGDVVTGVANFGNENSINNLNLDINGGIPRRFLVDASDLKITAKITNGRLQMDGARTLTIKPSAFANTFSGLIVNSGLVLFESPNNLVALPSGNLIINNGVVGALDTVSLGDAVSVVMKNGFFNVVGGGTEKLAALSVDGGAATFANMTSTQIVGPLTVQNGGVVESKDSSMSIGGAVTVRQATLLGSRSNLFVDSSLTLTGGTATVTGNVGVTQNPAGLHVRKQIVTIGNAQSSVINGPLVLNNAGRPQLDFQVLTADGAAAQDLVINGPISALGVIGKVIKDNIGTAVFNGDVLFSQPVLVNKGTLLMNGSDDQGQYTVNAATLGGTGSVNNIAVNNGGLISPGLSPGLLSTQHVQMNGGSRLLIELNGVNAGEFDVFEGGDVTLINNPILDVRLNFNVSLGDTFQIVTGLPDTGVIGRFRDPAGNILDEGSVFQIDGKNFVISYVADSGRAIAITRGNSVPAFANRSATSPFEGTPAIITGQITEPDLEDTFFLEVDWADGSAVETFEFPPGSPRQIAVSHIYAEDGVYTAHLVWRDEHGGSNEDDLEVVVRNAAPVLELQPEPEIVRTGDLVTLSGAVRDAGVEDPHRVTIDWNDGAAPEHVDLAVGQTLFSTSHSFVKRGRYRVHLTVIDDDGGSSTSTVVLKVKGPGLTAD